MWLSGIALAQHEWGPGYNHRLKKKRTEIIMGKINSNL
jgi:hypothetical protein